MLLFVLFSFQGTLLSLASASALAYASALVGSSGLEPPTSRLSGARSSLLSYEPVFSPSLLASGGDEEIRTLDPLLAGQVLSHLSYTPSGFFFFSFRFP